MVHKEDRQSQDIVSFLIEGISKGRIPELTGGGLIRSAGGWKGIEQLRRAKEYWRGDERILGDGDFVKMALKVFEEKLDSREKFKSGSY